MGISINVTFLLASLIVFWIIPAIGFAKKHLVDDRFFYSTVVISNAVLVTAIIWKNQWYPSYYRKNFTNNVPVYHVFLRLLYKNK